MNLRGDAEVQRLVVFAAAGGRFGIALEATDRIVRMVAISPLPGSPPVVLGAVNVSGRVVAVVDVCRRLGLSSPPYGPESYLVLARTPRRRLALAVEEVQGVVEVPADAVSSPATLAPAAAALAGAVALRDGIVFINDLEAFLSADEERQLDRALRVDE